MFSGLGHRVLPLLQITRMALVFTAVSNAHCGLLLLERRNALKTGELVIHPDLMLATAVISIGLYGFGMVLNDIIDRRRDRELAAHRPLPSGRMNLTAAQVICGFFALEALLGGIYFLQAVHLGWISLVMVGLTMCLIGFYDLAGKYLVAPGLVALGLIRFFQAIVPAPHIPLLWHPLLLLNHVAILSAVAYAWEEKRPVLTRKHWLAFAATLAALDGGIIGIVAWRATKFPNGPGLWIEPGLLLPAAMAAVFAGVCVYIRKTTENSRQAGAKVMLAGLLWLIVYDASFAAAYVNWISALCLLMLLPLAYGSVMLIRAWSKLMLAAQRPEFRRAHAGDELTADGHRPPDKKSE